MTELSVAGLDIKLSEGAVAMLEDLQKLVSQIPDTHKEWLSNTHLDAQFQKVISKVQQHFCRVLLTAGNGQQDFRTVRFSTPIRKTLKYSILTG